MRTIKINVRAAFGGFDQKEHIRSTLLASSITLKSLEVSYDRGLHRMVLSFIGECHSLLRLIVSNRNRVSNLPEAELNFAPTWKANLQTFTWDSKLAIFNPNESQVYRLREAKEVAIWSSGIKIGCAIKLMSSSPNLITLELSSIQFEASTSIPPLVLLELRNLTLRLSPNSKDSLTPKALFKSLKLPTPPLHRLCHPKSFLSRSSIQSNEAHIGFDFSSG